MQHQLLTSLVRCTQSHPPLGDDAHKSARLMLMTNHNVCEHLFSKVCNHDFHARARSTTAIAATCVRECHSSFSPSQHKEWAEIIKKIESDEGYPCPEEHRNDFKAKAANDTEMDEFVKVMILPRQPSGCAFQFPRCPRFKAYLGLFNSALVYVWVYLIPALHRPIPTCSPSWFSFTCYCCGCI
jgi:hypothetical protein